jgi:glycosyltransferase involved in cell wall biosynthesis
MAKPLVMYISKSLFPTGQAYSERIRQFARMFDLLGWRFHAIVDYAPSADLVGRVIEFDYGTFEADSMSPSYVSRIRRAVESRRSIPRRIIRMKPDLVVVANAYDRFQSIRETASLMQIPVLLEISELYDESAWRLGRLDPFRYAFRMSMKKHYLAADGVIAVSSLLTQYFENLGLPVITVPALLDKSEYPSGYGDEGGPRSLSYFGHASNGKETFGNLIGVVRDLGVTSEDLLISIYGPSLSEVAGGDRSFQRFLAQRKDQFRISEKVPRTKALELMRKSDFTFFERPNRISSHAGFPTKLAESMMVGTPVIANVTGDIGAYLSHGVNGYRLTKTFGWDAAIKAVVESSKEDIAQMSKAARATAEESFEASVHAQSLAQLIAEAVTRCSA